MKTVLSRANLIDCIEPKVRPDSAVLIEDGRIRAILPSGEAGSGGAAPMIDLQGGDLVPRLLDVHLHPDYLLLDEVPRADQVDPCCRRDLPEARLQGHGAGHQPGCSEECDPARRP